jgi:hypothetical protein
LQRLRTGHPRLCCFLQFGLREEIYPEQHSGGDGIRIVLAG